MTTAFWVVKPPIVPGEKTPERLERYGAYRAKLHAGKPEEYFRFHAGNDASRAQALGYAEAHKARVEKLTGLPFDLIEGEFI